MRDEIVLGILDIGADQTQIPQTVAKNLQLRPIGDITITNADGSRRTCLTYAADMEFEGFTFPYLEIVGSDLPLTLIGRDILNQLIAEFNGPSSAFFLNRP